MDSLIETPAYHWTPANQRAFLEHLADHGSVCQAAKSVSMADGSAYRLRRRKQGSAFAMGWDAALQIAGARLRSDLMDRAIYGQEDSSVRDKESGKTTRQRKDNRLAMWMLGHIDTRVAEQPGLEAAISRLVAQDFDTFLDLVETDPSAQDMANFISGQMRRHGRGKSARDYDLSQFCALLGFREEPADDSSPDEDEHVIFESNGIWYTSYPPPPGFTGIERGNYEEPTYSREVTDRELAVILDDMQQKEEANFDQQMAENRALAADARDAYFGFVPEPEDCGAVVDDDRAHSPRAMNRKTRRAMAAMAGKDFAQSLRAS